MILKCQDLIFKVIYPSSNIRSCYPELVQEKFFKDKKFLTEHHVVVPWYSRCQCCTTLLNKIWNQVRRRFKSCLQRVRDSRWGGSLTMVPAGYKANRLSLVNYSTKTIRHHHYYHYHHHHHQSVCSIHF